MSQEGPRPRTSGTDGPGKIRLSGRGSGLVLLVLAAAAAAAAATFKVSFITDPLGPKAFPLTAAALLAGSGLALLRRPGESLELPGPMVLTRMAGVLATFVVYALLLPWLGFLISTTLAVWTLSLLFGGPWPRALLSAFVFSVALQFVFSWLLALPLPLGSLWVR